MCKDFKTVVKMFYIEKNTPQLTVRKELDWQAIWPIRTLILCAAAAIRAQQLWPVSKEIHVKTG